MIEVVNMRTCNPPWGQVGDVRIDRATKWGNPFPMSDTYSRDFVLDLYTGYMQELLESNVMHISEIAGAKRLGCWCKPKRCHGDFLKKLIEKYHNEQQRKLI
jgi:hypothetical protein